MAYIQHRFLNPSQPQQTWQDVMPMRASLAPVMRYNYPYPVLINDTPLPGSKGIGLGDVFGLGETFDYVKMAIWIAGGLTAGYFVGYLYRELRTANRRRNGRRRRRRNALGSCPVRSARLRRVAPHDTTNRYCVFCGHDNG